MIKKTLSIAIVLWLSLASAASWGQRPAFYPEMGAIEMLGDNQVRINDEIYLLSPTVKVMLADNTAGTLSDVRTGTLVGLDLITINRRQLVDRITILPAR